MNPSKDVLLQILSEAGEQHTSLGKTQLVKFLYLTEVEYYRTARERLTGLRWLFYHYGPYALELEDILTQPEFESEKFITQSDKEFVRFRVAEQMGGYKVSLSPKITLIIKRIVGQWKDKPLPELLDYVYFETEPMQTVRRRGDELDFSTIRPESEIEKVIPLKASKPTERKIAELRERIKPFLESMGEGRVNEPQPSEDYAAAMKAWAEEEGASIVAPPSIIVHLTKQQDDSANKGN